MRPPSLVRSLEPAWQRVLDQVLASMRPAGLSTTAIARLAPSVKALSQAYNRAEAEGERTKLPLEAKLAFSFPRDVPKGAAAARELVATGILAIPADRPLRILDLGAGLGAMTWGIVRALEASGASGSVEALFVDEDGDALRCADAIFRAARSTLPASGVDLTVRTRRLDIARGNERPVDVLPPSDVVVLGQVLSEIAPREDPAVRVETQSAMLAEVLGKLVVPGGVLVIVEPALRNRTRHLHALRDRLLVDATVQVLAPCLHRAACPMLAIETEWCHEDLPVDLPAWVVPLARAAGLRWQGLTFSYLVLQKGAASASEPIPASDRLRFRTVSDLLRSKGKVELVVCDESGARRRIRRLDRDAALDAGVPIDDLRRGDIVTLSSVGSAASPKDDAQAHLGAAGPVDASGRVIGEAHAAIDVGTARK